MERASHGTGKLSSEGDRQHPILGRVSRLSRFQVIPLVDLKR